MFAVVDMSFFKEAALALGVNVGYSIIDYGGEAIYIEGIARVLSLDETHMRFVCGKKVIGVKGEGLSVAEYGGGCVGIKGRIFSFEEEDVVDARK